MIGSRPTSRGMGDYLNLFEIIGLTPGGRPILIDDEVEIQWIDEVNIQTEHKEDIFSSKIMSILLTNMKIIILFPQHTLRVCAWTLHYKNISHIKDCATTFHSSKRIRFSFHNDERKVEIKFLSERKEIMMDIIQRSLQKKSWEQIVSLSSTSTLNQIQQNAPPGNDVPQFTVQSAGISGLIRRQEREHQSLDNVKREALSDLDTLMSRAKEVVAVIDRYAHMRFDKADDQSDTSSEIGIIILSYHNLILLLICR